MRNDPRFPARRRERDLAWLHDHVGALTVRCPACGAAVEVPCANPITGDQINAPAHWQRLRVAEVAPSVIPTPRPAPAGEVAADVPA